MHWFLKNQNYVTTLNTLMKIIGEAKFNWDFDFPKSQLETSTGDDLVASQRMW
jgi:hypothetical protein